MIKYILINFLLINGIIISQAEPMLGKALESYQSKEIEFSLAKNQEEEFLQRAIQAKKDGDLKQSTKLFELIYRNVSNKYGASHEYLAVILDALGELYTLQSIHTKAIQSFEKSVKILEDKYGTNHIYTANGYVKLALALDKMGDTKEGLKLVNKAQMIVEKAAGKESVINADMLENIGFLEDKLGNYKTAEDSYRKSLSIKEKIFGENSKEAALTIDSLARLFSYQRYFDLAIPLYQRALDIKKITLSENDPSIALTLSELGSTLSLQGKYEEATKYLKEALSIYTKYYGNEHQYTAWALSYLSENYRRQGLLSNAIELLSKAHTIAIAIFGKNHPDTATYLSELSKIYKQQGKYLKALEAQRSAIEIEQQFFGANHLRTISSWGNLADIFLIVGRYDEAIKIYEYNLNWKEQNLGATHPSIAPTLNNLAISLNHNKQYQKAIKLLERSLDISEKSNDPKGRLTTLGNLASAYSGIQDFQKAATIEEEILEDLIKSPIANGEHIKVISSNLSATYLSLGENRKATNMLKKALTIELEQIQREAPLMATTERIDYIFNLGSHYNAAFSHAFKDTYGADLALFARLNRHGILEELEYRQSRIKASTDKVKEMIRSIEDLSNKLGSLNLSTEKRKELNELKEELEIRLYKELPVLKPRIIAVEDIAKELSQDEILIEFQHYQPADISKGGPAEYLDARYMALTLDSNGVVNSYDLGPDKVIENKVNNVIEGITKGLDDTKKNIAELKEILIEPLNTSTKNKSVWYISPDAELNLLPFAALNPLSSSPKNPQIRLITTGRQIQLLKNKSSIQSNNALLVVAPEFDRSENLDFKNENSSKDYPFFQLRSSYFGSSHSWKPLNGTLKEGQAIHKIIRSRLLIGKESTTGAIKQIKSPKLLHIASHGYYLPKALTKIETVKAPTTSRTVQNKLRELDNPLLRSGIVLAGANNPEVGSADDGYLTALEITQLDWGGTEMVVVSACESGLGDQQSGESVYGLKRAIAVAGARSSLLSLWKVDDEATAAFMTSFYKRLKAGMGRGDALSATQKEFREHQNEDWREPYVWAAFQLSGDWGPIEGL